jgi:2-dehydro-3-deoxyphosphogalactonate aldolase
MPDDPDFSSPLLPPIVAILRGIRPPEIDDVAAALCEAGIGAIEIPLNSPSPWLSLQRLCKFFGTRAICGAGTVLAIADVDRVAAEGGRLIVAPNSDPRVIAHAIGLGLQMMPGFQTATEALSAVQAGARALKLYPAQSCPVSHLKAMRDILPNDVGVFAVGGIDLGTIGRWIAAGAVGVGVGGALYRPGDKPELVRRRALSLVAAFQKAMR